MDNNKKNPIIRFEEFKELYEKNGGDSNPENPYAWEQRKLGDITESFSGGTPSASNKAYYGGEIPFIRSGEINDDSTELCITNEGLNNSSAKVVNKGDILYALYGATSGEVGISQINGAINQAILAIIPTKNDDSYLITQWLKKQKNSIISTYLQGGQGNLSGGIVKDLRISLPVNKDEQKKIGKFFKALDDAIDLQQRKVDKILNLKKAMLEKMFPKDGEKIPEVRFEKFKKLYEENGGDSNPENPYAWEQRKLGEVANHRGGTAIEKHFSDTGKYKVISIGSYGLDSKYVDQNIRAISNEVTDARVVRKGELTMVLNDKTSNGTIIGRSLLINTDDEYVINQRTEIISPKENLDSNFAYVVLNVPFREKVKRIVQGGTQIYVNYPAVENLEFELPTIEEQVKIGAFFSRLDNLITLQQHKLTKLKNIKKALLKKMFI